jgi:hypothetical protein
MSEIDIENWMHASDDERAAIHSAWDVDNDEGREVVESVAELLKKECVYDVLKIEAIKSDGAWQILAYAGPDYDSLKDRDIEFLGFKLAFKKVEET